MRRLLIVLLMFVASIATVGASAAQERIALIVGNADYTVAPKVLNTTNDARLLAEGLRRLGFVIFNPANPDTPVLNVGTRAEFATLLQQFKDASRSYSTSLAYFSGHGVQINGAQYLLPTRAPLDPTGASYLPFSDFFVSLQGTSVKMLLLDACRDEAFGARAGVSSFGAVGPDTELLNDTVMKFYAAQPGRQAWSYGRNPDFSPFAYAFVRSALRPRSELLNVLRYVREDVRADTQAYRPPQFPDLDLKSRDLFYFNQHETRDLNEPPLPVLTRARAQANTPSLPPATPPQVPLDADRMGRDNAVLELLDVLRATTLEELKARAATEPAAAYLVAIAYNEGIGVATDRVEFDRWARAARASDFPPGVYLHGYLVLTGRGLQRAPNVPAAIPLLEKAAQLRVPKADYMLGRIYFGEFDTTAARFGDPAKASLYLKRAADARLPDAMLTYGRLLYCGRTGDWGRMNAACLAREGTFLAPITARSAALDQRRRTGLDYIRRAAEARNEYAHSILCVIADTAGRYAEARASCIRAAQMGEHNAQGRLGDSYMYGRPLTGGGAPNYVEAFNYFVQATSGDPACTAGNLACRREDDNHSLGKLACLYALGRGRAVDKRTAKLLWDRSGRAGWESGAARPCERALNAL
jgi:TPR repeat protein